MHFLRNTWYVAAHAQEVQKGALFHRKILNEQVLIIALESSSRQTAPRGAGTDFPWPPPSSSLR